MSEIAKLHQRLMEYQSTERHASVQETMYWFRQYKKLAIDAISLLVAQSVVREVKPRNNFRPRKRK